MFAGENQKQVIHMYVYMYDDYARVLTGINTAQLSVFHLKTVSKDFKQK